MDPAERVELMLDRVKKGYDVYSTEEFWDALVHIPHPHSYLKRILDVTKEFGNQVMFTPEHYFYAAMRVKANAFMTILRDAKERGIRFTPEQWLDGAMILEEKASHYLVKATLSQGVDFTREDHFNAALTSDLSSVGRLRSVTSKLGISFTFQQYLRAAIRDARMTPYVLTVYDGVSLPWRVYRFFLSE